MKKMLLVLFVVLAMTVSVPAFADTDYNYYYDHPTTNNQGGTGGSVGAITNTQSQGLLNNNSSSQILSPSATGGSVGAITNTNTANGGAGGAGGSVTISPNAIKNSNSNENNIGNIGPLSIGNKTFSPSAEANQKQKQQQGQFQGQGQGQNQFGYVAPVQEVSFTSPTPLLGLPAQEVPTLNFGNGRMRDASNDPVVGNYVIWGIKKYNGEPISELLSSDANVKYKNLIALILKNAKGIANGGNKTLTNVRLKITKAEAQKSWNTGGNLGGGGSGLASSGLGGGSGAGSLIPTWGGTKADDLFTVEFVKVVL